MKRRVYAAMACVGALLAVGGVSAATVQAEPSDAVLNEYVVTAQRMQTKELDTPADVQVITAKQIEASGASNAYEALQNVLGVTGQAQGFYGTSMGTMTSKIMIRGVEKGTLVLMNGVPINADGKYNLDDISADMIKKIEVIRGGGSVMYGSDATGGVINIITKTKAAKSVSVGVGNYGQQKYNVSMSEDGLTVIGAWTKKGAAAPMSWHNTSNLNRYDYRDGDRKNLLVNYDFKNGFSFTTRLSNNRNTYDILTDSTKESVEKDLKERSEKAKKPVKPGKYDVPYYGAMSQQNFYDDKTRNALLRYNKDGWDVKLSYDMQQKSYDKIKYLPSGEASSKEMSSWRDDRTTMAEVQKEIKIKTDKLIVGGQIVKENLHVKSPDSKGLQDGRYVRTVGSLYTSYVHDFNAKDTVVVSGRQTWAGRSTGSLVNEKTGKETNNSREAMHRFTPEVQFLHRIGENQSVYARIGQSFRLPNLTQVYGTQLINKTLHLRPEHGTNYEIGYKANTDKADYRVTLFHYDLKDAIEPVVKRKGGMVEDVTYKNQDERNTGIEASVVYRNTAHVSTNFGVMYQTPKVQASNEYNDSNWHNVFNRWQITSGVNYAKDKWSSGLSMNWVGDRTSIDKAQRHIKSQLFMDLDVQYKPNADQKIQLHINNLLNRRDITTNRSSNFYTLGRNYVLTYKYNF